MDKLLLGTIIGLAAGIIDIIPMIAQKLDKKTTISAFLHYLFVAIIIVNIDLPYIAWWLKGGIIALALAIPVVLMVSATDEKSVPIILTTAAILGTLIGFVGHYFS
jgi:formate-dependent nitrite reductase membrane component NrfD